MADDVFEKVDLPSGGWVSFRDPETLTERQRKPVKRAWTRVGLAGNLRAVIKGEMSPGDLADSEVDLLEAVAESCAAALIESWSFTCEVDGNVEMLPPTIEAVGDLMPDDYAALILAASKHRDTLLPDFSPAERTDAQGRENPTGSSPE